MPSPYVFAFMAEEDDLESEQVLLLLSVLIAMAAMFCVSLVTIDL